jgi:hypothetical protein
MTNEKWARSLRRSIENTFRINRMLQLLQSSHGHKKGNDAYQNSSGR